MTRPPKTFSSKTDKFEMAYLEGVERSLGFPYRVSLAGWVIADPENYRSRHEGAGLEFCLRLSSAERVAVDRVAGRTLELPFPHVLVKRPGVLHETRHDGGREAFFLIYPAETEGAFRRDGILGAKTDPAGWTVTDLEGLRGDVAAIRALMPRIAESGVADEIDARAWTLLVRIALMRTGAAHDDSLAGIAAPRTPDEKLREWEASLHRRCGEHVDFGAEARRLGLSRSVFYRRWKKLFGESPEKRLARLRFDVAARLLRATSLSVKQIAAAVHDPSPAHFSTAFRARFGVSPIAWRSGRTPQTPHQQTGRQSGSAPSA